MELGMVATSQKHRFTTRKEALLWLDDNNFKRVRGMKGYYLSDKYSANLQRIPSGAWVVIVGIGDRG